MASPGHTPDCVSVIVENCEGYGKVAIAGDLFEKEEDIKDQLVWQSAGSFDKDKQRQNRYKISQVADYIIPGHGPLFRMTEDYREILKGQTDL